MQTDPIGLRRERGARSEERAPPSPSRVADAPAPATAAAAPFARSHVTRGLHLLLLLIVIHQLVGSAFVERPLPGEAPDWPYVLHQWVGIAGFGVVLAFWLWTLLRDRRETGLSQLVPWFSSSRRRAVLRDIVVTLRGLASGQAKAEESHALASAVHGLGLATVTFMALTGASWLLLFEGTPLGRLVLGLHGLVANLMWAYLLGHAGVALLHQAFGGDVLSRIFWFRRRRARPFGDA
jgi:cytochrome b561